MLLVRTVPVLFLCSRVIRIDAARSIRAAFTPRELARAAGLEEASVQRCWPQRMLLAWRRGR